jgi:hypothetical protein
MKTMMRDLLVTSLFVVGGMVMSIGNAQCADEPLPPEVKKLIGMEIPSFEAGGRGGLPGWVYAGSTLLRDKSFGVEYWDREEQSIFLVSKLDTSGKHLMVLDAKVLPRDWLTFSIKNGETKMKKQWWKFYAPTSACERNSGEVIVGLVRPVRGRHDCSHKTKQIKRAWKIDEQSGHISEISSQGISCNYMGGEYSCESN